MHNPDEAWAWAWDQFPAVPGFGDVSGLPSLTELGGEGILASDSAGTRDPDLVYSAALAVSREWADLTDRAAAMDWLRDAIPNFEVEHLVAFNNIVLTSANALPDLAEVLAEAWEELSDDDGLRGNVAIEAWTRLALAGWTENLPVRAALGRRAKQAAVDSVEADIFLVRSLGAAMDVWPSPETRQALERLSVVEEVECDVAFELAMVHIRQALSVEEVRAAAQSFAAAHEMFVRANLEGERPDAVAFAVMTHAIDGFLNGQAVGPESIEEAERAVVEWHLGYLGQVPEWRQARAETAGSWARLLGDMGRLTELDEPWLDANSLLTAVGELFANHQATTLVANPRSFPTTFGTTIPPALAAEAEESPAGLPVSFAPRIDSALTRTAESLQVVDRWLEVMSARLTGHDRPDAVEAIQGVRDRIRKRPAPGKTHASREALLPETIREALELLLDEEQLAAVGDALSEFVGDTDQDAIDAGARVQVVPLREQQLLRELTQKLAVVLPAEFEIWGGHLTELLAALVRVVSVAIDREQGGKRKLPWHRNPDEGTAPEAALADFLALSIQTATGMRTHVEIPNIGGGRADVVIPIGMEQFVIEVKRITSSRTNDALTADFGPQASEYTKTSAPFAFLGVLDLTAHTSRLDIGDSFWISEWSDDNGRKRALTSFRVLGNVSPPSATS